MVTQQVALAVESLVPSSSGVEILNPVPVCFLQVFRFPPTSQKHAGRWTNDSKLPLSVIVRVHSALQWAGVLSRVYSCLTRSVLENRS